jgi:hypothetical protein
MESNTELLAERYGQKKPLDPKRYRPFAIAGVVLMTITAMWFGYANYSPISHQDVGFRVISEWQTEVDFEVTKPRDATVICSIQTLNNSYLAVGYLQVELGPSDFITNRHTVAVNTTELAVTGLVHECRLR